jgi:hypothetical protein
MNQPGKFIRGAGAFACLALLITAFGPGAPNAGASSKSHAASKPVALSASVGHNQLVTLTHTACTYNAKTHTLTAGGQEIWAKDAVGGAQGTITVTWSNTLKGKKHYAINEATGALFVGPWSLSTEGAKPVSDCTVTPSFAEPTAASVESVLMAAGLPISGLIVYNATTDPNHLLGRPTGYSSKDAWQDGRIDQTGQAAEVGDISWGGGIEVFPNAAEAQERANYLQTIDAGSSLFGSEYDYTLGPILVRISGTLTPDQAATYQSAFPEMTLFQYVPPGTAATTTTTVP